MRAMPINNQAGKSWQRLRLDWSERLPLRTRGAICCQSLSKESKVSNDVEGGHCVHLTKEVASCRSRRLIYPGAPGVIKNTPWAPGVMNNYPRGPEGYKKLPPGPQGLFKIRPRSRDVYTFKSFELLGTMLTWIFAARLGL